MSSARAKIRPALSSRVSAADLVMEGSAVTTVANHRRLNSDEVATSKSLVADDKRESVEFLKTCPLFQPNQRANNIGAMVSPEEIITHEWNTKMDLSVGYFPARWQRAVHIAERSWEQFPELENARQPHQFHASMVDSPSLPSRS